MSASTLQKLEELPFFTLEALRGQLGSDPLYNIKYNLKTGKTIRLKRGFYVSAEFVKKMKYQGKFEDYLCFLATKLLSPSYLSLEYMLANYSILSESPFTLTLITVKTPRVIKNPLATFTYYNIKNDLFCGFEPIKKGEFEVNLATKTKAFFDYLYLKKRMLKIINKDILKELRLNIEELSKNDWKEFERYIALAQSKKMEKIAKLLKTL